MKLAHFKALAPICPACRVAPVVIAEVIRGDAEDVQEGLLECSSPGCQHLYPIVDSIPMLVADLRRAVSEQVVGILARDDLSERLMGLLGECCGPSSALDAQRQHLSSYCWSHWGDFDRHAAGEPNGTARIVSILATGLESLERADLPAVGPIVDLGCSVGRATYELAHRTPAHAGPVVGVDLNFAMLRMARRAVLEGHVRYARRRGGLVYEERGFDVPTDARARVDFWCADVLALPFSPGTFGFVNSLNLLDCLQSPLDHLKSVRDLLRPGGGALIATPFDWSPAATAPESWVGGHSPYGTARGSSEQILRSLLGGDHPAAISGIRVVDEVDGLPWLIRLHERSTVEYGVDLFVLARSEQGVPAGVSAPAS
jgi:SAM-dependent methyltransferase/uncharacterized protein YbaR (Trm112 family)